MSRRSGRTVREEQPRSFSGFRGLFAALRGYGADAQGGGVKEGRVHSNRRYFDAKGQEGEATKNENERHEDRNVFALRKVSAKIHSEGHKRRRTGSFWHDRKGSEELLACSCDARAGRDVLGRALEAEAYKLVDDLDTALRLHGGCPA